VFFQHALPSENIADVRFAHQLIRRLAAVRQQGIRSGLYPTGACLVGGPNAEAGLTGRKIIGETHGGMGRRLRL
jgi:S-adenosylmethionine synthetase